MRSINSEVQQKAAATLEYYRYGSEFTTRKGGKSWKCALIPNDGVAKNNSFQGLFHQLSVIAEYFRIYHGLSYKFSILSI